MNTVYQKNFRVRFETAKLLSYVGYDIPCNYHYNKNGELCPNSIKINSQNFIYSDDLDFDYNSGDNSETRYSAPLVAEVINWLFIEKSIIFNYHTDLSNSSKHEIKCYVFDRQGNINMQPIATISLMGDNMVICEEEAAYMCLVYLQKTIDKEQ